MREVVIFRHNLFKISEPFIVEQAQHLARYRPVYVGRLRHGEPPAGAESLALEDVARGSPLPLVGWQVMTRDTRSYRRLLVSHRPTLIHAHFGVAGVYALPLARRLGVPLVTTFHGFDATLATPALLASPEWAQYRMLRGRLAREGSLALCASSFIRERLLAMGFPEDRTRVHYIGVDCEAIQPRDLRAETPVILHVARLVAVKGTEYLIRAFAQIARARPEMQLIIIGEGPRRRRLQALVGTLGLQQRVRLLGARPHAEVLDWMRRAAMLVLPSVRTGTGRAEGLGMVLLEAAASGVPTIGTRQGGVPEAVLDGRTGFLVPERDTGALARRVMDLLEDVGTRRRMGVEARIHVERNFDLRRQTAQLEDLYDSVSTHAR
ncbi:MAG: glycosyltransferase [Steroidobacteraceae bacterium]